VKKLSLSSEQKFLISTTAIGFSAGLTAVGLERLFHLLADLAGTMETFTLKSFILGVCYILIAGLLMRKVPGTLGSGIPRTKLLLAMNHGVITVKEWVAKFFTTVLTLASGAPLGLEAPTIAISAGIGSTLGQRFFKNPKKLRDLVYIGSSAGIAAAFNTPIAAVIFTMEELIGNTNARSLGTILIGSLVASVTAATFKGENSLFIVTTYKLGHPSELMFYLLLGLAAGLAGPLFVRNIVGVKKISKRVFRHHFLTPMIIGIVITGAFSFYDPLVPGPGVRLINELLAGKISDMQLLAGIILLKFFASAFCYGSGMSGGILLPTMVIGAAFGTLWGSLSGYVLDYSDIQLGAYALVGIGAFLAAVIKTPFTAIVLVFEMTRDYRIVLPLMIASLVAWLLSEKQFKGSIYEYMANLDGLELPAHEEDELNHISVQSFYKHSAERLNKTLPYDAMIYPDQSVSVALAKLRLGRFAGELIVVNRLNPLEKLGTLRLQDILTFLQEQGQNEPTL
jgi:CIC family chloride channel protein